MSLSPPSSGRSVRKVSRPTNIGSTARSQRIQEFLRRLHGAFRHNKGVVLTVPVEDQHELSALLSDVALKRTIPTVLTVQPTSFDIMPARDRGVMIENADLLSQEQQTILALWMKSRDVVRQPVYAIIGTEGRWRYCKGERASNPPSSQRDRIRQWSPELLKEFGQNPVPFPRLEYRQDDLLGIMIATLDALKISEVQSKRVRTSAEADELLRNPPSTVLNFVNEICTIADAVIYPRTNEQHTARSIEA